MKKCWRCPPDRGEQPLSNFCRNGKDSVCKKCRYELNADWAKDNREKLRPKRATYMRDYRARKKQEEADGKSQTPPSDSSNDE